MFAPPPPPPGERGLRPKLLTRKDELCNYEQDNHLALYNNYLAV